MLISSYLDRRLDNNGHGLKCLVVGEQGRDSLGSAAASSRASLGRLRMGALGEMAHTESSTQQRLNTLCVLVGDLGGESGDESSVRVVRWLVHLHDDKSFLLDGLVLEGIGGGGPQELSATASTLSRVTLCTEQRELIKAERGEDTMLNIGGEEFRFVSGIASRGHQLGVDPRNTAWKGSCYGTRTHKPVICQNFTIRALSSSEGNRISRIWSAVYNK